MLDIFYWIEAIILLVIFKIVIDIIIKNKVNNSILTILVTSIASALLLKNAGINDKLITAMAFIVTVAIYAYTWKNELDKEKEKQYNIVEHIRVLLQLVKKDLEGEHSQGGWTKILKDGFTPDYDLIRLEKSSYIYELDAKRGSELIKAINNLDQKIQQYNQWYKTGNSDRIKWIKSDLFDILEPNKSPYFYELIKKIEVELSNYNTPIKGVRKKPKKAN